MRPLLLVLVLVLPSLALAGCGEDGVKEFEIHVGWNADGKSQYMTPSVIRVDQGDKVRFVVINDDDPNKDYNGAGSGFDNFHDVALLDYDGDGDGIKEDIEHEVPAGQRETTNFKGRDYFIASEKGTFTIICEVLTSPKTHQTLGMKAQFVVS